MGNKYDKDGRVIVNEPSAEQTAESPMEKQLTEMTKLLGEIRDFLSVVPGHPNIKRNFSPLPKKKPGRPRKVHQHEV